MEAFFKSIYILVVDALIGFAGYEVFSYLTIVHPSHRDDTFFWGILLTVMIIIINTLFLIKELIDEDFMNDVSTFNTNL